METDIKYNETENNVEQKNTKSNKGKGFFSGLTTLVLLGICVLLALVIAAKIMKGSGDTKKMGPMMGAGAADSSAEKVINVYAKKIENENFVKTVKFYGMVNDEGDTISVSSSASGYVTDVLVHENDIVKAGDIIGYVDPSKPGAVYQKAPVKVLSDGEITDVKAAVGQYMSAYTPFATEKTSTKYVIKINVPEKYIDNIHIGTKAYISSSVRKDLNTQASVTDIGDNISSSTRTFEVEFKALDTRLFASGLAITMNVVLESIDSCFTVPKDCVHTLGENQFVYIVKDGKAVEQNVVTSSSNDYDYVITSGLNAGDYVVTEGSVSQGNAVKIVER